MIFAPPQHLVEMLRDVRFVVMDVDGTIRSSSDTVGRGVAQILGKLEKAGIGWSFATGRTIAGLKAAAPAVQGLRRVMRGLPAICCNGAVLFVPGAPDLLSLRRIEPAGVRRAIGMAEELGRTVYLYRCVDELGTPVENVCAIGSPDRIPPIDVNGMPIVVMRHWRDADLADVVAVLIENADGAGDLDDFAAVLGPSLNLTASGGPFLEVSQVGTSKGEALASLVRELRNLSSRHPGWSRYSNLTEREVMAVGDSYNDVDMMRVAGVGVAVANAPAAVKRVADHVCSLPAGQGAVEAIRLLLDVQRYGRRYPLCPVGGRRPEAVRLCS